MLTKKIRVNLKYSRSSLILIALCNYINVSNIRKFMLVQAVTIFEKNRVSEKAALYWFQAPLKFLLKFSYYSWISLIHALTT